MKLEIKTQSAKETSLNITDKVKSFEDACKVLGVNGEVLTGTLHEALENDGKAIETHLKLLVIVKALNEGWTPDWSDDKDHKYYPWFDMENGFVLYHVNYYDALTDVGSRLCFKSRELAEYAAKQFLDLYKDYFTI
ncbi:MAG: hypothetical protein ACEQSR_03840 [Candidatus Methylacidiphilales bacterium]